MLSTQTSKTKLLRPKENLLKGSFNYKPKRKKKKKQTEEGLVKGVISENLPFPPFLFGFFLFFLSLSFCIFTQQKLQRMFCTLANQRSTILGPLYFAPSTTNSSGLDSLSSSQAYCSASLDAAAGSPEIGQTDKMSAKTQSTVEPACGC